jgi:hypothetical protein
MTNKTKYEYNQRQFEADKLTYEQKMEELCRKIDQQAVADAIMHGSADNKLTVKVLGGIKHDQDKVRLDLLPTDAIEEIAKVLAHGANKYGHRNWEKGFTWSRLYGAVLRHLFAWFKGEDKDPETGLSHLAHAGCNILFLLTFELRKTGADDRPKQTEKDLPKNLDIQKQQTTKLKYETEYFIEVWYPSLSLVRYLRPNRITSKKFYWTDLDKAKRLLKLYCDQATHDCTIILKRQTRNPHDNSVKDEPMIERWVKSAEALKRYTKDDYYVCVKFPSRKDHLYLCSCFVYAYADGIYAMSCPEECVWHDRDEAKAAFTRFRMSKNFDIRLMRRTRRFVGDEVIETQYGLLDIRKSTQEES